MRFEFLEVREVPRTDVRLETTSEGVFLPVKARAGASRNAIQGWSNDALRVSVTQVAEKGKANKVLREVLAKDLGLRRSQVVLVSGETSPQKRFLVRDASAEDLIARIQSLTVQ